jgi:hypothetical protein
MPVDLVVSIGLQAVAVSPAPEPSAYAVLVTGLMVLFAIRFRKSRCGQRWMQLQNLVEKGFRVRPIQPS